MSGSERFDKLLEALSDGYRRELLLALSDHNPQDDDDPDPLDIHGSDTDAVAELNIFMNHLPMLEKVGIIEWDQERDKITKGPDWEEFEPLLRLMKEHQDDLPAEWFEESETD